MGLVLQFVQKHNIKVLDVLQILCLLIVRELLIILIVLNVLIILLITNAVQQIKYILQHVVLVLQDSILQAEIVVKLDNSIMKGVVRRYL